MIEKERIEEAKRNVKQYLDDGLLKVKDKDAPKFVGFFMKNAESSLQAASILQEISDQQPLKSTLKVSADFESYLWVIVSSYYSMFYAATALLASQGMRVTGQIVHKVTADALINFFVSNAKLAKLLEQYEEAKAASLELIGRDELMKSMQKRAHELIVAYESERKKRSRFQYDIGVQAKRGYAQTSLDRARVSFSKPRYKRVSKLHFIQTETDVDQLIGVVGKKTATFLQLIRETGVRPREAS